MRSVLSRLERSVAAHGVVGTARISLGALRQWLFLAGSASAPVSSLPECELDCRLGVDTQGAFVPEKEDVASRNWRYGARYQGVDPLLFRQTFDSLGIDFRSFTFLDLGSGKGRALMLAAGYPFRRIVGVEYSRSLHQTAQRNLARCRTSANLFREVEVVCLDAAEYPLPEAPLVLFLYNPFGPPVLQKVAANVEESWRRAPRRIIVTYFNPVHASVWERASFLQRKALSELVAIYDTEPGSHAAGSKVGKTAGP